MNDEGLPGLPNDFKKRFSRQLYLPYFSRKTGWKYNLAFRREHNLAAVGQLKRYRAGEVILAEGQLRCAARNRFVGLSRHGIPHKKYRYQNDQHRLPAI